MDENSHEFRQAAIISERGSATRSASESSPTPEMLLMIARILTADRTDGRGSRTSSVECAVFIRVIRVIRGLFGCSPAALRSLTARIFCRCSVAVAVLVINTATAAEPPAPSRPARLDRNNLLIYRDAAGARLPVITVADWEKRRAEILADAQQVMGPLPDARKRCALEVRIDEETDCGVYVRRLISYAPEPNSRVPAYLLVPKSALAEGKPCPAVLCLHGTDHTLGHKIVVGLGGKTNRQYAAELAARGYVTLAPSYPQLANYQPDLKALGYASGTMKAIWDNIRGLDLLESLPFVKRGGFGAIGHSLGGHNAVYTAVFDPRLKVIVSSCGLDSYLEYYSEKPEMWLPGKGWTQERYMPRLADYRGRLADIPFDFHELIGALAPRVCYISAPLHDGNFNWRSVDAIVAAASQVYQLNGAPQNLRVEHPDCDHDFPNSARERAYKLFDEHLR